MTNKPELYKIGTTAVVTLTALFLLSTITALVGIVIGEDMLIKVGGFSAAFLALFIVIVIGTVNHVGNTSN